MTNLIIVHQRVNGKDEPILINHAHIERIIANDDDNQVLVIFTTGVKIHVSMSLTKIGYLINSQND